jgi:hypothetical protein
MNRVFKYSRKGDTNDMDTTIEYIEMKVGNECVDYVDYVSGEGVEGDADDGRGKQKVRVLCEGRYISINVVFINVLLITKT